MIHEIQEYKTNSNIFGIFAGLVVGGLAGAITMLLLAPQSGSDTRMQIQKKGIELRDQTSRMMDDAMTQVRSNASKISIGGQRKAEELLQQGQALVIEQLDHVSDAVLAGKKAIKGS